MTKIHQRCHACGQCYEIAGGWLNCEMLSHCDEAIPRQSILHWESAVETVARSGRNRLQVCQYVGTC